MSSTMAGRKLNPTERRLTTRESLKYYNAITVAGIYKFLKQDEFNNRSKPEFYFSALKQCIETHPILSVVVENAASKNERFVHVQKMNLHDHVVLWNKKIPDHDASSHGPAFEDRLVRDHMQELHNKPAIGVFNSPHGIPPWRVYICPVDTSYQRILICFTYSHVIGDGMSGSIFHDSFLAALNESLSAADPDLEISDGVIFALPHLPVSLTFLLAPALGHYLPKFVSKFFGFKASVSGSDSSTWLGAKVFDDRTSPDLLVRTAVEVFTIDHDLFSAVLRACRKNNTKLTAVLNELIALCFSRQLVKYDSAASQKTNLISCIPINLRTAAQIPPDTLGNIAGATYSRHSITHHSEFKIDAEVWRRASAESANIARSASKLQDQVTGLLGWISNMRTWMEGQLGQARDSSWQISNLMAFNGGDKPVSVERMFFCQPADVIGQPLDFNVMSVKHGELIICAGWQVGALGLDKTENTEDTERRFVLELLQNLKTYMKRIASG